MAQQSVLSVTDLALAPILAFNEKNWDKLRALVTPGYVYDEIATGRRVQGVNDVLALWRAWATAFPDSKATVNREFVSGTTVTLEITWRGTHTGPLQTPNGEIAATGKKIELRACQIVEVTGDKAASARHYFDMTTLLRQIGTV
jgi:steroid delta-isomerase-like uncharacterized protein